MQLINFSRNISLNVIIKYHDKAVGTISFNNIDKKNRIADIGYWLSPIFEHQGIMARSLNAMCKIGFIEYNLNKIIINAVIDNDKSNQVAKKAGFHLDGTFRDQELLSDGFHDENQWSLLKRE
ncbi:GNAT family N-acetyltransferase [Lactobacillus sp. S2-2]|uniref:GNAT family N-acetyltransferase n=1 Tax=Lactobacillus sp. S2-2 TaxID=2692917 RepID=UPI001F2359E3|nr:GNAT family protein [Lactobacillus sp. S2-2]MCF6514590.1 GNAT family N-acetyltransferase [Lactobacillus sp. S2-2]